MGIRGDVLAASRVLAAIAVAIAFWSAPAGASTRTCEVALRLDNNVTAGAIQLTIDYSIADGSWKPTSNGIACYADAPNTLAPFVDDPVTRVVTASFVSLTGIQGPRKIAHCYFIDTGLDAIAQDFVVFVDEAVRLDGTVIKSAHISVAIPSCVSNDPTTTTTTSTTLPPTTSTSTTTSTLPDATTTTTTSTTSTTTTSTTSTTSTTLLPCGDGIVEEGEQCDDGNLEDGDGCEADCTTDVICGDVNGNDRVSTSDALMVLRAAIGQLVSCPDSRCDADGDEVLRASDSLRILKRAVGQSVVMACPRV
jgi:cysteine-rich repeat protein